ncbi:MAG: neutral zinc metallopeptidase [Myxococcota bacterium]
MRRDGRRSTNIEDRRGQRMRGRGGAKLGAGGTLVILVLAVVVKLAGGDPTMLLDAAAGAGGGAGAPASTGGASYTPSPEEERLADFVAVVLADTEDTWGPLFQQQLGRSYQAPKLVLFGGQVSSACGMASSAVGPFYCPADQQVYIDLQFFSDLDRRFGAPGDFAQAYVVAHEVGHHVQTILGISQRLRQMKAGRSRAEQNQLSVAQELQADCFSGVWAHHAHAQRQVLEQGDIEEGLRAAAAIGDDTLQRRAGGRVQPESWTHGSSEERVRWFRVGLETGQVARCNSAPI